MFWVDLDKVDLTPGAAIKSVDVSGPKILGGKISGEFETAQFRLTRLPRSGSRSKHTHE
ncbi:MAG TPA: hypothetical protein VLG28_06660 [Acidimicrobiia bacterium]|nr:hypothetical protein [Acidimicrobiia bacterium]